MAYEIAGAIRRSDYCDAGKKVKICHFSATRRAARKSVERGNIGGESVPEL